MVKISENKYMTRTFCPDYFITYKKYGFDILAQANMFHRCATSYLFLNTTKIGWITTSPNMDKNSKIWVYVTDLLSGRYLINYKKYSFDSLVQENNNSSLLYNVVFVLKLDQNWLNYDLAKYDQKSLNLCLCHALLSGRYLIGRVLIF